MNQSENILLQRFAASGDAAAFSEIVHRYAGLVYGVCLRILADKDDAADATQETFFQLVKQAKEITGSVPNWLHKVAKSKAIDRIRKDSRRRRAKQGTRLIHAPTVKNGKTYRNILIKPLTNSMTILKRF